MIKHEVKVHVVGQAMGDAKLEMAGTRPVCKFGVWAGFGKEDFKKKDSPYLPTDTFNCKAWGRECENLKKGDIVEFFAVKKKQAYTAKSGEKKIYEFYEIQTDEKGNPQVNYPGIAQRTKHLSDEAVAAGQTESLNITDDDDPFI